jgi:hypothetical protein
MFDKIGYWTMENKVTSIALNIILVGMIVLIGLIAYWGFRPYNIIEFDVPILQTEKEMYEVGEPLTYRSSFYKKGNYEATIIRSLHDGVVYLFPVIISKTREGSYDFISTTTTVPNVPSGTYIFETEIIYHPNPIREITYNIKSNEFEVVNNN